MQTAGSQKILKVCGGWNRLVEGPVMKHKAQLPCVQMNKLRLKDAGHFAPSHTEVAVCDLAHPAYLCLTPTIFCLDPFRVPQAESSVATHCIPRPVKS